MDYYMIVGMVVICLIAIIGCLLNLTEKIKNSYKQQQEPMNKLNLSITELTAEIRTMRKNDEVRDKRLDRHGLEIDDLKLTSQNHEIRLKHLEKE